MVMRGYFVLVFVIVHIGHEDFFGILFIDENVSFNKLDALIVNTNLNTEIIAEEVQQILSLDVGV